MVVTRTARLSSAIYKFKNAFNFFVFITFFCGMLPYLPSTAIAPARANPSEGPGVKKEAAKTPATSVPYRPSRRAPLSLGEIAYRTVSGAFDESERVKACEKAGVKTAKAYATVFSKTGAAEKIFLSMTEEYLPSHKLLSYSQFSDNGSPYFSCSYKYDDAQRVVERETRIGNSYSRMKFSYAPDAKLLTVEKYEKDGSLFSKQTISYDARGWPVGSKTECPDNTVLSDFKYSYDESKRMLVAEDLKMPGKSTKITSIFSPAGVELEKVFRYSDATTVTTICVIDSSESVIEKKQLNPAGLITSRTLFEYGPTGLKTSEFNWSALNETVSLSTYEYNEKGLLTKQVNYETPNARLIVEGNEERIKYMANALTALRSRKPSMITQFSYEFGQ